MNEKILISIGLPVYNGEKYFEETIESVLSQTYDNFELVISDNCSDDETESICRKYALIDGRIKYHRLEQNLGAAENYNKVFELSKGKYFAWVCHDDTYAPTYLERCLENFEKNPEIAVSYTKAEVIDAAGNPVEIDEIPLNLDIDDAVGRFNRCLYPMTPHSNAIFGLMRRDILENTRLIGKYLGSDRVLVAEINLYGRCSLIDDCLFFRRKKEESIGTQTEDQEFFDPKLKKKIPFPEWRISKEHLISVKNSPHSAKIKRKLRKAVYKWMFGIKKTLSWELKRSIKYFIKRFV